MKVQDLAEKWAPRFRGAHFVNVRVRINGDWKDYEADDIASFIREEAKMQKDPRNEEDRPRVQVQPGTGMGGMQASRPRWRVRFSSTTIAWLSFAVLCLSAAWWLFRH